MKHVKSKGTDLQNTKTFKDSKHKEHKPKPNPQSLVNPKHHMKNQTLHTNIKPTNKPINFKPKFVWSERPEKGHSDFRCSSPACTHIGSIVVNQTQPKLETLRPKSETPQNKYSVIRIIKAQNVFFLNIPWTCQTKKQGRRVLSEPFDESSQRDSPLHHSLSRLNRSCTQLEN